MGPAVEHGCSELSGLSGSLGLCIFFPRLPRPPCPLPPCPHRLGCAGKSSWSSRSTPRPSLGSVGSRSAVSILGVRLSVGGDPVEHWPRSCEHRMGLSRAWSCGRAAPGLRGGGSPASLDRAVWLPLASVHVGLQGRAVPTSRRKLGAVPVVLGCTAVWSRGVQQRERGPVQGAGALASCSVHAVPFLLSRGRFPLLPQPQTCGFSFWGEAGATPGGVQG